MNEEKPKVDSSLGPSNVHKRPALADGPQPRCRPLMNQTCSVALILPDSGTQPRLPQPALCPASIGVRLRQTHSGQSAHIVTSHYTHRLREWRENAVGIKLYYTN
ncbi:hypothetical protein MHYP_G00261850 [Metynnis hypsauchen]